MYQKLLLTSLALAAVSGLSAKHLTPQEALARAAAQPVSGMSKAPAASSMEIKRTLVTPDNTAALYVFEGDGNALIVPADDRVAPVLGYIDGRADGEMPPQMEWWISEYVRQIDYLISTPDAGNGTGLYISLPSKASETDKAPIAPLVTTSWDQASPYNYSCPTVSGSKAMTGCVATAAAQIMKYHEYPAQGSGTISYVDANSNTTRTLALDGKPFDWDNMLDSYAGTYNNPQRDAVAYLMQAVGYASEMAYSSDASGAQSSSMLAGMKEYFSYSDKATLLSRQSFPLTQWEDLIYENLKTVGPVYYAGDDYIQGGHAFVCDGYSSDGFFHFNWGWSGAYDGYFKLTALTPEGQGIGGNAGGFNFGQEVVLNLTSPGSPTIDLPATSPITLTGNLTGSKYSSTAISLSSDQMETMGVFVYNSSDSSVSVEFGIKAVNQSTGEETFREAGRRQNLGTYEGFTSMSLYIPSGLTNGDYRMYLVVRDYPDGEWLEPDHDMACVDYVNVTISSGQVSSVRNVSGGMIEAYDLETLSSLHMGYAFKISYMLENNSDTEIYDGITPVIFTLSSSGQIEDVKGIGDSYAADMLPGQSLEVETVATLYAYTGASSFSGAAYLGLMSLNNGVILTYTPVTVESRPSTLSVTATEFTMDGDQAHADPDNLVFNCGIRVTRGYWADPLSVYICETNGTVMQTLNSSETFFLDANESAAATVSGSFPTATEGATYIAILGYVSGNYVRDLATLSFIVDSSQSGIVTTAADSAMQTIVAADRTAGILSVIAPSDIASVEAWTMDGRRVALELSVDGDRAGASLSTIPEGIILVKVTLADGSTTTVKVAK